MRAIEFIVEGVAEGKLVESAVFLNPTTVVVGQAHGQPLELSPNTLKQIQAIAAKHGAWYEGNGTDRGYTKGQIDRYVGSWDDEVAKTADSNDPKWIYVLFANVDENNRVQRVGIDPNDTIFNRLLDTAKDNSFQGIGYTSQALQKFLQMASEGKYDFVKMSQQPATQKNLTRFLKAGEALMWPSNWEQYPNKAGKIAKAATVDVRDQYLATRKAGVYVTGSGHLKAVQNITGKQGVAEGLDEAVGGNYLYHATGADGLKGILSSDSIRSATGPQAATSAQTKLPTVSVTRDWGYASGSNAGNQMAGIARHAVLVLDRNVIESNFKTLGTSQSNNFKGLALNPYLQNRSQNTDLMARTNAKGKAKYAEPTAKAGGEFEEAVVVPKGALPLKGTMVGFWVNPKSELMKDPAIMNDPRRLDMVRPNQFVKAKQTQGVAESAENFNGIDITMEKEGDVIMVRATAAGRELGHVLFVEDGEYLMPQDLEVEERFQGQGIAAAMYDYVKSKGYKIRRSGQQTDAGAGFWDKHKSGKNVWEQGVAEDKLG